jgi:hypothetical protein
VLLASLVVAVARAPQRLDDRLQRHAPRAAFAGRRGIDRRFERRQRDARVAARGLRDARQ